MRVCKYLELFKGSNSGAVALVFAVAFPAILGAIGLSVDYASVMNQRSNVQSAADAAALNAARELIISEPTVSRLEAVASASVTAILHKNTMPDDWTVRTTMAEDRKAVTVLVARPIKSTFGLINALSSASTTDVSAQASARLAHNSKLCLLTMGDNNTSIYLHKNARLTGQECSLHSNSTNAKGIMLEQGSQLTADLVCSRGGIANTGSTVASQILNDCPPVLDPLRARVVPPSDPCTVLTPKTYSSGTHSLTPGTYCGGVDVKGTANVRLAPGTYVFKFGPLRVRDDAALQGTDIGLFFTGNSAYFKFEGNALIDLSGPLKGAMAGLLIWRDKLSNLSDKSDPLANMKVTLWNTITSNRANKLTGTIYLPEGTLYIGAKAPVAQISDYTVILARRVEIFDGPNLVLNTNYGASPVPVPQDLGPIGLKDLKLER